MMTFEMLNVSDIHGCQRFVSDNTTYCYVVPGTPIAVKSFIMAIFLAIFLMFLLATLPSTLTRFKEAKGHRKIRLTYYLIICITLLVRLIRFVAEWIMLSVSKDKTVPSLAKAIVSLILRVFLFGVEISLIVFMYHGIRKTRNVIKRVILESCIITLVFAVLLILSNWLPNMSSTDGYDGPTLFWTLEAGLFMLIYSSIIIIRYCSPLAKYLPHKRTYYTFIFFLLFCHTLEFIGHILTSQSIPAGYCFLSIGHVGYYILFLPLVYISFLWSFLHKRIRTDFETESLVLENDENYENLSDEEYDTINSVNSVQNNDMPDALISSMDSPTEYFGSTNELLTSDNFRISKFSSKNEYNGL